MNNVFQIYEYEKLQVGTVKNGLKFTLKHFNLLTMWHEKQKIQFITIGYNTIIFRNYVGVISVGDISIEILPKVDRLENKSILWRDVLLDMLHYCGKIKIHESSQAHLRLKERSILEYFLYHFMNEVDLLVRKGLVKKYRRVCKNEKVLKGKLNLNKQLVQNLIHKERFYVTSTVYDYDNQYNQIIKLALKTIALMMSINSSLIIRSQELLINFEDIGSLNNSIDWNSIHYDRNTDKYRDIIKVARFIIENMTPDISTGKTAIVAFLFDMNTLFEEYIFRQCQREVVKQKNVKIASQKGKLFWKYKRIIPDIILTNEKQNIIVDTKWKFSTNGPTDSDLKQMYVYNLYWNAVKSYLLYPGATTDVQDGEYYRKSPAVPDYEHSANIMTVDVIKNGKLNRQLGSEILSHLM